MCGITGILNFSNSDHNYFYETIKKINVINKCTYCSNALYHSYRRSGTNAGRMFALVGWPN